MMLGLLKTVKKRGSRVPLLIGYGNGVSVEHVQFQMDREALTIDYAIVPEDEEKSLPATERMQGLDELQATRELRRLTRAIECSLPATEGWDVRLTTKASSKKVEQLPWTAHAIRSTSYSLSSAEGTLELDQVMVKLSHAPLLDDHSVLKVRLVMELSSPTGGLRLNGIPHTIHDAEEERDPASYTMSAQLMQDVSSSGDLSGKLSSSAITVASSASSVKSLGQPGLIRSATERTAAAEKTVLSRVRRNYIYFSSLLQEPEAKWRRSEWLSTLINNIYSPWMQQLTFEAYLLLNLILLIRLLLYIEQRQHLLGLTSGTCTVRLCHPVQGHTGTSSMMMVCS